MLQNHLIEKLILRKYERETKKILALRPYYAAMSDTALQAQTADFRQRIKEGASLKSLLTEAYAVVCEADRRVLGLSPFANQITGAIVLNDGAIAEMKTGEGKTLTATMPMYLNGLMGPGNYLVTANAYLANRDATEIGEVYRWLGLSVASGVPKGDEVFTNQDKQGIYQSDIVYTTNSALGFDYLLDNLVTNQEEQYMGSFNFALIDEVDAVLLDMAQTPLVISGKPRVQSNLYDSADQAVLLLTEDRDYQFSEDRKKIWFTSEGIHRLGSYFAVDDLLSEQWQELYRQLILALKANYLLLKNRDYVVADDEILLLDQLSGRQLPGVKLQAGLHQAVETKERLKRTPATRAVASITYQNLFRMFRKLAGMTGTAQTDAAEFRETYHLNVIRIPTHLPILRRDVADRLFATENGKFQAVLARIQRDYERQRPILVETASVQLSHQYSDALLRLGIPHNLLNARSVAKEAAIIQTAGQAGMVTVTTAMAGRGTDIKLGPDVPSKQGLLVIGTEKMQSRRIDNQLRGRSGRQGDPGESAFYVALSDRIVVENGSHHAQRLIKKLSAKQSTSNALKPLTKHKYQRILRCSQAVAENESRLARFQALQFDEVFRIQRGQIYRFRKTLLTSADMARPIDSIVSELIQYLSHDLGRWEPSKFSDFLYNHIAYTVQLNKADVAQILASRSNMKAYLNQTIATHLEQQLAQFAHEDQRLYFKKIAVVKALDDAWIEQVDMLAQLRNVVASRSAGSRNPVYEYQKEAQRTFGQMRHYFWQLALRYLLLSTYTFNENGTIEVIFP